MSDTIEKTLTHYGVKGMRWGVRRTDKQLAAAAKKRKGKRASDAEENFKKLSDNELREKINRLNMEVQYSRLTASPPSKKQRAAKLVGKAAARAAEQTMASVIESHMQGAVANLGLVAPKVERPTVKVGEYPSSKQQLKDVKNRVKDLKKAKKAAKG